MRKIYSVEEANYLVKGDNIIKYNCIDNAFFLGFYEFLDEAEELVERLWCLNQENEYGFIINEITSVKDYDSFNEFVKEFKQHGNDNINFFMEQFKEINTEVASN